MQYKIDWQATHPILSLLDVTVGAPRGALEVRNGRLIIGLVKVCNDRIRILPREGVTRAHVDALARVAEKAFLRGPSGRHWGADGSGRFLAVVGIPYDGSCSSSSFASAQSEGLGATSQSNGSSSPVAALAG